VAAEILAHPVGAAYPPWAMPTLRSQLDVLAANFANDIIAALQGASLHELAASKGTGAGNGHRVRAFTGNARHAGPPAAPKKGKPGRLPRRSADEIAKTLDKIVLLVKTHKEGMRAEEIRSKLGMQAKEMPRILKQGLAAKKLTSKGQKRATTYFVK
jgi:hypothetical protein